MQPRVALVALVAALLGAALMWIAAPTVGETTATSPPVARVAATRFTPSGATSTDDTDPPADLPSAPARVEPPPPRTPSTEPRFDRSEVQEATMQGLASSALARRDDLISCWEEHVAAFGEPQGRFTLELGITRGADGGQTVTARVPTAEPDVEELDACISEVFADARFDELDGPAIRLMWPVPMPRR